MNVPHGFTGKVQVSCGVNDGFPAGAVNVDSLGMGGTAMCPSKGGDVTVFRDGAPVGHTPVFWERTGDQLLVGFSFSIK